MAKRWILSLLSLIAGIMILSGCFSKSNVLPGDGNAIPHAATPVQWNFLVYLDGDNNLDPYAIADINEMEMIGSDANVNILVLLDRSQSGSWTDTRLYKITKDPTNSNSIVSQLIKNYGELDMSHPTTLKNFIVDCQTLFPANRTVLTLWAQGDGIYPRGNGQKGICWDDTTGVNAWDCLTDNEVLTALAEARATTGKKIDILNCDADLMQMMEVAYEWRTEAAYLVGSEAPIPGDHNNYDTILATLRNNPTQSTLGYAKALVYDYYNYYKTANTTSSVISLGAEFTNLINAFKAFATAMYNTTDFDAVTAARNATNSFLYDEYKDLYGFADNIYNLSTDANARSKAAALKTALTSAILLHMETGTMLGKAYGLSIFLPKDLTQYADYSASNQYPSFYLSVDSDWDNFIKRYLTNPAEWNFLVYLDGDNNLDAAALADLNEMELVGSDTKVNVLVLFDRYDSGGTSTGTKLYRVIKDATNSTNIVSELVANYGELDMSDPETLKNFIVNCQQLYPAKRTVLTLWAQGDGAYPRGGVHKGICWDDTTGVTMWDCLTDNEVLTALSSARAITGKKIDILNCDADLMQMMEVAYEWQSEALYLVGSEESGFYDHNNYDTILPILRNNPTQATVDFAKALVDDYNNYYRTLHSTSSVISLGAEFTNLVSAFKAFATAMYNTPDLSGATTARAATVSFTYDEYKDLYGFADNICKYSTDANARSTASALKTAIASAVLLHRETGAFVGKAYGLSILLTQGTQYDVYKAANQYPSFRLSIDSYWDEFISRL